MKLVALTLACAACGSSQAAPADKAAPKSLAVVSEPLCVTRGAVQVGSTVDQATVRAVAPGTSGDAAAIALVLRGTTEHTKALANGDARRQVGLKLRAQDGCNLVYVMWRLDPKPKLEVSVKRNPGKTTHEQCGADGYTKVKAAKTSPLPALDDGAKHELHAEIDGAKLTAWVDGHVVWRGALPASAAGLEGPAGIRSDNLAYDLVSFTASPAAASGSAQVPAKCRAGETD